jgi:O-antigen ligase
MVQTKHLSNYVIFGALASTLFVLPILMDPVALPKLFILSFFHGAISIILFRERKKLFSSKINFILFALVLYSIFLFLSGLIDNQGLYQIFMGTWGRNNGFFQVLFFAVLFLGSIVSNGVNFPKKIIQTLFLLGIFFSSYAWLQHFGRDPITAILPWYKRDQPIVLTLGNSNFSSIFLAITFTATCVTLLKSDSRNLTRIISTLSLFSHFLLIRKIDTQGKISFAVGFALVGFIYLFFNKSMLLKKISFVWGFTALLTGMLGVTALFGIGPFAGVLSDNVRSLNDRYYAWLAALKIMRDNPLFGIGIDNFVDSYRLYRLPEAYEIQTSQPFLDYDNAHNIFLNIGATAGIPCLLAYLSLIILVTYRGLLAIKNNQEKLIIGGVFSVWIVYLVNSIISVDNLGLSVWGWVSGGALVSMSISKDSLDLITVNNPRINNIKQKSISLAILFISFFPSFYIIPSLINENKIFNYISNIPILNSELEAESNLNALFMEAKVTKQIGLRLVAIDYLGYANFLKESQELSKISVIEFPDSFWAWEFLARSYEIQGDKLLATPARQKTIELDPLNIIIKQKLAVDN